MTDRRIDVLARSVANRESRRNVIKRSAAVAAGGLVMMTGVGIAAAKPGNGNGHAYGRNKVAICHRTGDGTFHFKRVPTPALKGHTRHGDVVCAADACKTFDGTCGVDGSCGFTVNVGAACGEPDSGFTCDETGACVAPEPSV